MFYASFTVVFIITSSKKCYSKHVHETYNPNLQLIY